MKYLVSLTLIIANQPSKQIIFIHNQNLGKKLVDVYHKQKSKNINDLHLKIWLEDIVQLDRSLTQKGMKEKMKQIKIVQYQKRIYQIC